MPAPKGNTNAMTNGVYRSGQAARAGLRARKLPKGFRYIQAESARYANNLAAEVELANSGQPTIKQLTMIDAAAGWHQHSLFVLKVLRDDFEKLKPDQKVAFSAEVAKARQQRSRCVAQLGLDSLSVNPWDALTMEAGHGEPDPLADPPDNTSESETG